MTPGPVVDVLVADDEPPAVAELVALLSADDRVSAVHTARNGTEALRRLAEHPVGVAFLDIHMPGLDGFALARTLREGPEAPAIVFVTADDAQALEAFDVRAVDYVLKPVRAERLRRALDRALEVSRAAGVVEGAAPIADETVPATVGNLTRLIRRTEVRWVQSQGDYSRLWTADGGHLVRIALSELADRWAAAGFVRIHRSYLVHRDAVSAVRFGGPAPQVVVDGVELPVSRRLVAAVRAALVSPGPVGESAP